MWNSTNPNQLKGEKEKGSKEKVSKVRGGLAVKHLKISEAQKVYELYDFKEEIGHGSFGVVVLATEKASNKSWAVKIVHKNIAGASKLTEVDREIKILKTVNHPNIIYLDRVYESPKKIYMILELCPRELYAVWMDRKPFSEKMSKKVILQLADAVSYLHKTDIVHRDIKMENILLADNPADASDECFIKLTDFGLSIVKSGVGIQSLMSEYCGTVVYMPPEILAMKTYSELCDVWAIGVIMFMMLYGKYPFMDKTEEKIRAKICHDEPDYKDSGVGKEAVELLKDILKKNPVQRITASQIKENPWLSNKQHKRKEQNIVDMMKQFATESSPTGPRVRGLSILSEGLIQDSSTRLNQQKYVKRNESSHKTQEKKR
ncbi:unnamed protein product [Ceutorhynchus assimilis]|uniref:non-specific serine/threonine protein kinase n=1 Tax=Ceutorhynchus assimilis TaxID=467358 RepID=A0A9P0DHP4_9CUCU|nr:unnamed protein product [Ceutorhynchus assimilis]